MGHPHLLFQDRQLNYGTWHQHNPDSLQLRILQLNPLWAGESEMKWTYSGVLCHTLVTLAPLSTMKSVRDKFILSVR